MLTGLLVSALAAFAAGALRVAPVQKVSAKQPSFGRVLANVGTSFRTDLYLKNFKVNAEAYKNNRSIAPEWALDVLTCASAVKAGIQDLRQTYSEVHVPSIFEQACDYAGVYLDLGGDKAACSALVLSLKQEFQGEKNYHRWCRKAALAESESMKAALKMLESDAEAKELMGKCEKKCPSIAKIIETGAALDAHWMKIMAPPPADQTWAQWKESYKKDMGELDALHNTMCDHRAKAKCTIGSMAQSCGKVLQKIHLPKPVLAHMFEYCDLKAPCARACTGVSEKCSSFMDKQMFAFWGGNDKDKFEMCDALSPVEECLKKEECVKFMDFTGFGPQSVKQPRQMCDVMHAPCYKKITETCNSTRVAFYGNQTDPSKSPSEQNRTCAMKLGGMPLVNASNATRAECCPKFTELGKCAANIGCAPILKDVFHITPSYWYPYAEGIKANCHEEWHTTFDE